jgi:hypothetical protein
MKGLLIWSLGEARVTAGIHSDSAGWGCLICAQIAAEEREEGRRETEDVRPNWKRSVTTL